MLCHSFCVAWCHFDPVVEILLVTWLGWYLWDFLVIRGCFFFLSFMLDIGLVRPSSCHPLSLVSIDDPYLSRLLALFVSKMKSWRFLSLENCNLYVGSLWKTGGTTVEARKVVYLHCSVTYSRVCCSGNMDLHPDTSETIEFSHLTTYLGYLKLM